ncbi:lateral organ boundaries domain-containing protein [Cynara cardunculus var. scolymus]|uniref:Lateral organ boundaries domain-containing protein n=1 Tax=Cynara cardunculus var. scolymus TaxID=59895 RepID=A0A118K1S8_CYNCS|nr:lateral organ boundaries domain-containing protein [Cynara cardunculus var. scolymus]
MSTTVFTVADHRRPHRRRPPPLSPLQPPQPRRLPPPLLSPLQPPQPRCCPPPPLSPLRPPQLRRRRPAPASLFRPAPLSLFALSSSSQESLHEDFESLKDVFILEEGTRDGLLGCWVVATVAGTTGSPCGTCKCLRRKCTDGCIFAPYFSSEQDPARFAAIHKVFGASNVSKLLHHVAVADRCETVVTIAYEAQARIRDPWD